VEKLSSLDTCEHIWTAGVGFAAKTYSNATLDSNRTELLKLLLTCFSEVIYAPVNGKGLWGARINGMLLGSDDKRLRWVTHFTSAENRHVLPLFTSLLNTVCAYDPVGYGIPYNYLLVGDSREPLVQTAIQLLIVALDRESQPNEEVSHFRPL
jgi:High-temperature-induced dauer-formation protein